MPNHPRLCFAGLANQLVAESDGQPSSSKLHRRHHRACLHLFVMITSPQYCASRIEYNCSTVYVVYYYKHTVVLGSLLPLGFMPGYVDEYFVFVQTS